MKRNRVDNLKKKVMMLTGMQFCVKCGGLYRTYEDNIDICNNCLKTEQLKKRSSV